MPTEYVPEGKSPFSASGSTAAPIEPRRILVIDDKRDTVAALKGALELCGHQVQVAYDGVDGLERARRELPEVILCDIGLPGDADGYQVAGALRASPEFRSTFLVAVTGYAGADDIKRAVAAGFDLHLSKPVDLWVLLRLIAERFGNG